MGRSARRFGLFLSFLIAQLPEAAGSAVEDVFDVPPPEPLLILVFIGVTRAANAFSVLRTLPCRLFWKSANSTHLRVEAVSSHASLGIAQSFRP